MRKPTPLYIQYSDSFYHYDEMFYLWFSRKLSLEITTNHDNLTCVSCLNRNRKETLHVNWHEDRTT